MRVSLDAEWPGDSVARIRERLASVGDVVVEDAPAPGTTHLVRGRPMPEELDVPGLQAVIVPWAGIAESVVRDVAARPGLRLYNLHHNAGTTAEIAVGLLIACARGVVEADRRLREGVWRGRMTGETGVTLEGKTAVVLGYGALGQRVGRILEALGMAVIGVRRTAREGVRGLDSLDEALAEAQALVVCLPLTSETRGLVTAERIARLRAPRLLVNVGRGPVVDEDALFAACRDGILAGAGIDVWYTYPREHDEPPVWPSRHPFWDLSNVVLSPHRAGDSDATDALRAEALASLLADLGAGRPVRDVDPARGY